MERSLQCYVFVLFLVLLFVHISSAAVLIAKPAVTKYAIDSSERSIGRKFMNAAVSGAISCSATHSMVCPLDVVKTKMQTDPTLAGKSTGAAFQSIIGKSGLGVLLQGLGATSSGYFMQGFCKFGFYDFLKNGVYNLINDEELARKYKLPILIASSGCAEFIASWALCPLEVGTVIPDSRLACQ